MPEAASFPGGLQALVAEVRASRGFAHKQDIGAVMRRLGPTASTVSLPAGMQTLVPNGDDTAVLPAPASGGHLLFAIEGLVADFVQAMPWFAGYSGVLVNISDVAAMGGRPTAVVDALWCDGEAQAAEIVAGMRTAAERYGVPLVGGHTNLRHGGGGQLAVAVLGHAKKLITSFDAQPGHTLLMAVDLRGHWHDPYPFWDASTQAPAERLRGDIALLPQIAEAGLCGAGKDISMAGVLGTTLMLAECSGVGAHIDLDRIPRPEGAPLMRWLDAFPSFGYLLSVAPQNVRAVQERFIQRGIACAAIGEVNTGSQLTLALRDTATGEQQTAALWDLAEQSFITGQVRAPAAAMPEVAHA